MLRVRTLLALGVTALATGGAATAAADTVVLRDGATYDGRVEVTEDGVRVELDFGTVTFERAMVKRIRRARSRLDVFDERLARAGDDVDALLRLARWAARHGLERRARDAHRRIVAIDPDHGASRAALGHVRVEGRWLEGHEAKRAAGLVPYGGVWLSREEVRERERAQARLRREVQARRAAEAAEAASENARAAAEAARAAQIRSEAFGTGYRWGFPIWWRPYSARARATRSPGVRTGHPGAPARPVQTAPAPRRRSPPAGRSAGASPSAGRPSIGTGRVVPAPSAP